MALRLNVLPAITITTAGVPVQLSSTVQGTPSIIIQASSANTGNIFIGDSTVSSTKGMSLPPGASLGLEGTMLNTAQDELYLTDIWVDTATSGNKVQVAYLGRR